MQNIFTGPLLSILDGTLLMPNQILKRLFFENIDFHKKITKIEDFKVDNSKKTTPVQRGPGANDKVCPVGVLRRSHRPTTAVTQRAQKYPDL